MAISRVSKDAITTDSGAAYSKAVASIGNRYGIMGTYSTSGGTVTYTVTVKGLTHRFGSGLSAALGKADSVPITLETTVAEVLDFFASEGGFKAALVQSPPSPSPERSK
jgi:hypothetical protein